MATAWTAGASDLPSVTVGTTVILLREGQRLCAIGVINHSVTYGVKGFRLLLIKNKEVQSSSVERDLAPGQAALIELGISAEQSCEGPELFLHETYQQNGVLNDWLLPTNKRISSASVTSVLLGQITAWILGLLSATLGGWLAHAWTLSREREKERNSMRVKFYDTMQPAFRDFLLNWSVSPLPGSLQDHFMELERRVTVDARIVALYRKTYALLADEDVAVDLRVKAAQDLDDDVRAYVLSFDPYEAPCSAAKLKSTST